MPYLKPAKSGWTLFVQIQPQSSKNQIVGPLQDRLKIKIKAPPVDGAANEELIRFLAKLLGLKQNEVEIVHGSSGKQKTLRLHRDLTESELRALLVTDD